MFKKLFNSIKDFFTKNKYRKTLFVCLCIMFFCIVVGIFVDGMFVGVTISFGVASLGMYLEARLEYIDVKELIEEKASVAYDRLAEKVGKEQAYAQKTPFDANTDAFYKRLLRKHKQRRWLWMCCFIAIVSVFIMQVSLGIY